MQRVENGRFNKQTLQQYICASLAMRKSKYVIGVVPPGSGKTFILMLLAEYYAQEPGSKVVCLTCNEYLSLQMDKMLADY